MRFSTALVAAFTATTSAFLVPPNFPEGFKDVKIHEAPEHFKEFIHALLEHKTTNIDLACPGCPFVLGKVDGNEVNDGSLLWEKDVDSVIHLEFKTHGHDFNVNGHPLLPFEKAQKAQSSVITAHQTRLDTHKQSPDVPLNFAMEVMAPITSPHNDHVSIIPVEFTVLGLSGLPVKVNTISFKLIETPNKDLVIVQSEEIPFKDTPGAEACEGTRPWSMCRLKAIVMARVKAMMEAAKQKTDKVQDWVKEKAHHCKGKRPHPASHKDDKHPHPPHHDGHKHHPKPHHYHRLGHMLHQTFRFFIIPALLGVIGGLTASAIGMLVGQIIVLIWFKTYRRGQRGPLRVVEHVVVEVDEKNELLAEDGEVLPQYEDAPRYEEVVVLSDEKK